jgi:predicted phage-related endonuclease
MQATAERHPRAKIVEYDFAQVAKQNLAEFAIDYKSLKRQEEAIKAQIEEVKKVMIELMAGKETVVTDVYKISNKTITSNRLDTDSLKSIHPDIYKLFCKPSTSTRFTID